MLPASHPHAATLPLQLLSATGSELPSAAASFSTETTQIDLGPPPADSAAFAARPLELLSECFGEPVAGPVSTPAVGLQLKSRAALLKAAQRAKRTDAEKTAQNLAQKLAAAQRKAALCASEQEAVCFSSSSSFFATLDLEWFIS